MRQPSGAFRTAPPTRLAPDYPRLARPKPMPFLPFPICVHPCPSVVSIMKTFFYSDLLRFTPAASPRLSPITRTSDSMGISQPFMLTSTSHHTPINYHGKWRIHWQISTFLPILQRIRGSSTSIPPRASPARPQLPGAVARQSAHGRAAFAMSDSPSPPTNRMIFASIQHNSPLPSA